MKPRTTMPRPSFVAGARAFYVLAGGLTLLGATAGIAGVAGAAQHGCELVFSQADFRPPPDLVRGSPVEAVACQQYVDVLSIVGTAVLAALLLATAVAVHRRHVHPALGVPGALAGILAAAYPLSLIVWAVGYYRITPGPVEIIVGVVPLAAGLAAAWVLFRMAFSVRKN